MAKGIRARLDMLLEEIKNIKSSKKDLRNFGLVMGAAFLVIGVLLYLKSKDIYPYFLTVSAFFAATGAILPVALKPLYKVWMTFSVILGWVMTRVILTVLFFGVITPIALISRIAGKDFLQMKKESGLPSYWNYRERTEAKREDYERQF